MGSSKRLDFVTELKPEVQGIKAVASEQHNAQQCGYVKRSEMQNVNGKERELFCWIRRCECGNETDHSEFLDANFEDLQRTDGVEVHLRQNCKWMHSAIGKSFANTTLSNILENKSLITRPENTVFCSY